MFPSLVPTGSSSRYFKKPSQQEVVEELAYLEEKLKEQRFKMAKAGVPVLFHGQRVLTVKTNVDKKDNQDDAAHVAMQQQQQQQQFEEEEEEEEIRYLDSDDMYPQDNMDEDMNTSNNNADDDFDFWGINS